MSRVIRTPDQRLRVFVSSTLGELAPERAAVRAAIEELHLAPVMFELGARPHPPRDVYRAYLEQSHVFLGIYAERYGWIAPGEEVSGLEDEYRLAAGHPKLVYLKATDAREPRLEALLDDIRDADDVSYKRFSTPEELADLVKDDLMVMLSERFEVEEPATDQRTTDPPSGMRGRRPAVLTSTVGRDREVAEVVDRVVSGARLLTLTGTGGIGKTRLALLVAARLEDEHAGPVRFVGLDDVTDADRVVPVVADRLGVRVEGTTTAMAALAHELGSTSTVLVLDNLEQVVEVGAELAELLRRCAHLQLLVTSRRPLGVASEELHPVGPLEVPAPDATVAEAGATPAVRLFVARAAAVIPDFDLDAGNVDDVVAVCRMLDGVPLAIELAAVRLRVLSPAQLRARLGGQLDLLVGGSDRPRRQQTLFATIDWSHDLLDDQARALYARLGVFVGGFTLEAAEAVGRDDDCPDVLDALTTLVDQSLVLRVGDGDPRFRMLEAVRSHAGERLDHRGEADATRDRHLAFFRAFTERAQPYLCGPQQLQCAARVDPERGNLRAAIDHALASGDAESVVEMTWDVLVYYHLRSAPDEPSSWLRSASRHRDRLGERATAVLDSAMAVDEISRGTLAGARARLEPALAVFTRGGMVFDQSVVHMYLGLVALGEGDVPAAVHHQQEAVHGFDSVGHDWGVASAECFTALAHWLEGAVDLAAVHYRRGLQSARTIANEQLAAQALVGLAAVSLDRREWPAARAQLAEAVGLLERCRDAVVAATCLDVVAAAALAVGRRDVARSALEGAATARRRIGLALHPRLQQRVDRLATAAGGPAEAEDAGSQATPTARDAGDGMESRADTDGGGVGMEPRADAAGRDDLFALLRRSLAALPDAPPVGAPT